MKKQWHEFRVIPVVLVAAGSLLTLKTIGLVWDGGYVLIGSRPANAQVAGAPGRADGSKPSWAQEILNYPRPSPSRAESSGDRADRDITASAPTAPAAPADSNKTKVDKPGPEKSVAEKPSSGPAKSPPDATVPQPNSLAVSLNIDPGQPPVTAGERAVLGRLQERRQELESRARELDLRESLLKAAEKRLENRVGELKELETRVGGAIQRRDEAEASRFKGLVTMYESMKPKEAAKIFDRLEIKLLAEVATQMNPRRMSDILALMSAEAAERLTVELANRATTDRMQTAADLPKIEGRPANN